MDRGLAGIGRQRTGLGLVVRKSYGRGKRSKLMLKEASRPLVAQIWDLVVNERGKVGTDDGGR